MVKRKLRFSPVAYAFVAPSLFGVLAFLIAPVFVVIWLSFQSWDLIGPVTTVGFNNYKEIFSDGSFFHTLKITLLFALFVVPAQIVLGLLGAIMLTRGLRFSGVLRVLFVLPWIAAPLALGVVWAWIFSPSNGLLSAILGYRVEWLSDPIWALPTTAGVVIWQYVGYVMLFFAAGLLNIPKHIVDAARLDGAGGFKLFWLVTLPLLRPTMFFVLVTSTVTVFQLFDQIYALTGGGPFKITDNGALGQTQVVGMRIYYEAFEAYSVGRSAVMAVILLAILLIITVLQSFYFKKKAVYDLA